MPQPIILILMIFNCYNFGIFCSKRKKKLNTSTIPSITRTHCKRFYPTNTTITREQERLIQNGKYSHKLPKYRTALSFFHIKNLPPLPSYSPPQNESLYFSSKSFCSLAFTNYIHI